ncbi:MAG: hypothetical protein KatS3mg026_0510 [Bacteroidia bacterium]|nr:MAG: hypothetical protein KatS3mg026_0510 [Bacteroidia bacterium]
MMDANNIEKIFELITQLHGEHLSKHGVKLPRLRNHRGEFTVEALTLVFLARNYPDTSWVTKEELTRFVRAYYPNTNDVQSARHLGIQRGFYIVSSRRGNYLPKDKPPPSRSAYLLVTLEKPHPAFSASRRTHLGYDFEELKKRYDYRCATCGSKEGEPNLRYPEVRTKLQKAHRNPKLPLEGDNIIPQCQFCNRADRDYWVYDRRGRVVGIASIKPILKSIAKGYLDESQIDILYRELSARRASNTSSNSYEDSSCP